MDNQKQSVVERLQQANNILVTVSNNPSVDQLAACIGLTLALNKMGKHATAVFSGEVPSTIEFLQPERTIEKNTDSLRDFIIALDKSKADKLRYKVEDRMVKIFITPYRTSISQKDLDFSQGDFNVDVVLAVGVHIQAELDQAITSHGRILHDATVMAINTNTGGELGSINWLDAGVSSLSEMSVQIVDDLDKKLMDGQIATAFLTGIVAETERFSNQKTSPQTMSISAELMSAGANQQLVATKLEEPVAVPQPQPIAQQPIPEAPKLPKQPKEEAPKPTNDGTIEIEHDKAEQPVEPVLPAPETPEEPQAPQIHIDEHGQLQPLNTPKQDEALPPIKPLPGITHDEGSRLLTDPEPTFNSPLTANTQPEADDEPSSDPLSVPSVGLLNREPLPSQKSDAEREFAGADAHVSTHANPIMPPTQTPESPVAAPNMPPMANPGVSPVGTSDTAPAGTKTLSEIEQDVHSPHLDDTAAPSLPGSVMMPPTQPLQPNPMANPAVVSPQIVTPTPATPPATVDSARDAVAQAINSAPPAPEPIQALNAQPLSFGELQHDPSNPGMTIPAVQPLQPEPVSYEPPTQDAPKAGATPPPVPPPMMPPTFPQQ